MRQRYLEKSSPDFIQGINNTFADGTQIRARADAGGEGGVIFNSALAVLQGLFPPTPSFSETIGNGTNITAPLGGYQVGVLDLRLPVHKSDSYCTGIRMIFRTDSIFLVSFCCSLQIQRFDRSSRQLSLSNLRTTGHWKAGLHAT